MRFPIKNVTFLLINFLVYVCSVEVPHFSQENLQGSDPERQIKLVLHIFRKADW